MPSPGAVVFLVVEPGTVDQAVAIAAKCEGHVWVGADALTEQRYLDLVSKGHLITRFEYGLSGEDSLMIDDALSTIREHHPGKTIWVQRE